MSFVLKDEICSLVKAKIKYLFTLKKVLEMKSINYSIN